MVSFVVFEVKDEKKKNENVNKKASISKGIACFEKKKKAMKEHERACIHMHNEKTSQFTLQSTGERSKNSMRR